jgi:hypothetical protein
MGAGEGTGVLGPGFASVGNGAEEGEAIAAETAAAGATRKDRRLLGEP